MFVKKILKIKSKHGKELERRDLNFCAIIYEETLKKYVTYSSVTEIMSSLRTGTVA